ncbi:MAG: hypothetical protein M3Q95_01250 [Bacteroidota bacterium]|nr:hypothetical protein [Bacteroidota bacterium]
MMLYLKIITILFFAGLLHQQETAPVKRAGTNLFANNGDALCNGDIVMRNGKGIISEMFRKTSKRDQQFSHAGIIEIRNNKVYVVHVIGDPAITGSHLKTETVEAFCNSNNNNGYAIYRYNFFSGKEKAVSGYLTRLKTSPVKFDEDFDLHSDSALYCSELIYKFCLESSGYHLNLSGTQAHKYVGLDDLYLHEEARLITKQNY